MPHLFINGKILPSDQPCILASDRGFTLSDGLFETLKATHGKLHYFSEHYARLAQGAKFLEIPLNYNEAQLREYCQELLKKNQLQKKIAALRITLTRGPSVRGISIPSIELCQPTVMITASEYFPQQDFYPRAYITDFVKNEKSALTNFKILNYLESILACHHAKKLNYDEAILLNTQGCIAEASSATLFFVIEGALVTPHIKSGILPGIIRQKIINMCQRENIAIEEKSLSIADAMRASEIFQTNSLLGIQSFQSISATAYPEKRLVYGPTAILAPRLKLLLENS